MFSAILDFQLFLLLSNFSWTKCVPWLLAHGCGHKKCISEVNNTLIVAIWSNLAAILAAILDLQLTRLLSKICFGQIGIFDPENTGVDTKITSLR